MTKKEIRHLALQRIWGYATMMSDELGEGDFESFDVEISSC